MGGHLEVLQWARANGCPWDEQTCAGAAQGGHLEVLQWLHANRCPRAANTFEKAAEGNYLDVFRWALLNGCPMNSNTRALQHRLGLVGDDDDLRPQLLSQIKMNAAGNPPGPAEVARLRLVLDESRAMRERLDAESE
tara:strand:- start:25726 stop:26136 length:411 start_codon:yes stop_codon:yes gene_type:complete